MNGLLLLDISAADRSAFSFEISMTRGGFGSALATGTAATSIMIAMVACTQGVAGQTSIEMVLGHIV